MTSMMKDPGMTSGSGVRSSRPLPRTGIRQLAVDRSGGTGSPKPRLDALLLSTPAGLMLQGWLRETGKFDPDSVSAMMTAVTEFVRESMGTVGDEGPWRSQTISVGPRTVISVSAGELTATAVVAGKATRAMCDELKRLVGKSDRWYGAVANPSGTWVQSEPVRVEFRAALDRMF